MKKIHPIYFSSNKHFKYLLISIKTLLKLKSKLIGNIYLYVDEDDYFSDKQINIIKDLNIEIILRKTRYITHSGKKLILSELKAFEEVSKEIENGDYVAKTDSDIMFLNDDIFRKVFESDAILIGFEDKNFYPSFTQGGLYFIKSSYIKEIIDFDENLFERVKNNLVFVNNNEKFIKEELYPEDAIIYNLIKEKTNNIIFIPFMRIPMCYETKNPSVIHFTHNKSGMKFYFYAGEIGLQINILLIKYNKKIGLVGKYLKLKFPILYKIIKPFFPNIELK